MSKQLTEEDILRVMREEWDKKVQKLKEDVGVSFTSKIDGEETDLLSPGLKVLHKKSGIRYTIDSVGPKDIIVLTPEGEKMLIDQSEVDEYELD